MTLVRSDHRIHRLIGLQQWLFLLRFGTSALFYRILGIQERIVLSIAVLVLLLESIQYSNPTF